MPLFGLRPPNAGGKPVLGADGMFALLTFNIAFDVGIFPLERRRVNLHGLLLFMAYTGGRPAEFVNNESKPPKEVDEIFGPKVILNRAHKDDGDSADDDGSDDDAPDEESRLLENLLLQAVTNRGRPKALCYEDVLLSIVRHPETGKDVPVMAVKLVHHKGADRKPKP